MLRRRAAVALIYTVHDLSRSRVTSVSDSPAPRVPPPRGGLYPASFSPFSFSPPSFRESLALFDLRSGRSRQRNGKTRLRRKWRGTRRARALPGPARAAEREKAMPVVLFPVTFDSRLVTPLNLRRIGYIACERPAALVESCI